MADSDGSPQRDDRHHRWSRSRSPASPEWTGETLAEREERRLAEAAVLVGQPPPAREPEPAEVTAPVARAASPAAPPQGGGARRAGSGDRSPSEPRCGPDRGPRHAANTGGSPGAGTGGIAEGCRSRRGERGRGARGCDHGPGGPRHRLGRPRCDPQHAAKAGDGPRTGHGRLAGGRYSSEGERGGRARGCGPDTGGPRHRLGRPRRGPQHAAKAGDGPRTGHGRLAGGRHSSRGERGGRARGCDRGPWRAAPPPQPATPRPPARRASEGGTCTGHGRLAGGRRCSSSGQGEREVTRPRQPHPHPHQPPQAVPGQALPPGAGATRPLPGARALAAGRHAAAAAKTAGRPARDPGRRGGRAGRAACQPRERGAGGGRRQGKCPGARARSRPGDARQGARAQQRGGAERRQRTARLRAGGREGTRAREGRAGAPAGSTGAGGRARGGG